MDEKLMMAIADRIDDAQKLGLEMGAPIEGREVDSMTGVMAAIVLAFTFAGMRTNGDDEKTRRFVHDVMVAMGHGLVEGGKSIARTKAN